MLVLRQSCGIELHTPNLKSLDISGINVSAITANRLLRFAHDRGGNITVLNDFFIATEYSTHVRTLGLAGKLVGFSVGEAVATFLKDLWFVKTLSLSGNGMDVEGARTLASALKYVPQLTFLDLRWNNIGKGKAIAGALISLHFMFFV